MSLLFSHHRNIWAPPEYLKIERAAGLEKHRILYIVQKVFSPFTVSTSPQAFAVRFGPREDSLGLQSTPEGPGIFYPSPAFIAWRFNSKLRPWGWIGVPALLASLESSWEGWRMQTGHRIRSSSLDFHHIWSVFSSLQPKSTWISSSSEQDCQVWAKRESILQVSHFADDIQCSLCDFQARFSVWKRNKTTHLFKNADFWLEGNRGFCVGKDSWFSCWMCLGNDSLHQLSSAAPFSGFSPRAVQVLRVR